MPTLTTRKIIQLGHSALVITLPVGWVRYYNLRAGDKLEVITNGKLTVSPEKITNSHEVM